MIWWWDVIKIFLTGLITGCVAYFIARISWRREMGRMKKQARHEAKSNLSKYQMLCSLYAKWHIRKHIWARFRFHVGGSENPLYLREAAESQEFERSFMEAKGSLVEAISRVHAVFEPSTVLAEKARAIEEIRLVRHDYLKPGVEPQAGSGEPLAKWRDELISEKLQEVDDGITKPIENLIAFLDGECSDISTL